MTAHSKFFSTIARCLLFSVAMAVLGLAWGCGEVPSQTTLDDGAKARVQEGQDATKKAREKKKPPRPFAGPDQK
jgi:hypothetical protein